MSIVLQLSGFVSLFLKKMTGVLVSDAVHDIFRRMNVVAPSTRKDISPFQLLFGQALVVAYCKYNHLPVPQASRCWKLSADTTQKILNGDFADMILENELFGAVHNAVVGRVCFVEVKKENRFLEVSLMTALQEVVGDFFVFIGLGSADPDANTASFATLMQNTLVALRMSDQLSELTKNYALRNGQNGAQDIMNLAMVDAAALFKRRFVTPDLAFIVDPTLFIPANSMVYGLLEGVARVNTLRSQLREIDPLNALFTGPVSASPRHAEKAGKEDRVKGSGKGAAIGAGRGKGGNTYGKPGSRGSNADQLRTSGLLHWDQAGKIGFGRNDRCRYFDIKTMQQYLIAEHKMAVSEAGQMCFPVGLGLYKERAQGLCPHPDMAGHEDMDSKYHKFPQCKDVDGKVHSFGYFVRIGNGFAEDF